MSRLSEIQETLCPQDFRNARILRLCAVAEDRINSQHADSSFSNRIYSSITSKLQPSTHTTV